MTDRFTKAIEQLGSDKLDVRIGGIYALERIARDSAEDHPTVIEVLTAFIRDHSREPWPPPDTGGGRTAAASPALSSTTRTRQLARTVRHLARTVRHLAVRSFSGDVSAQERLTRPDIQAAATVVGRRDPERDSWRIDLTGAKLTKVGLNFALLRGARLGGAIFDDANLVRANLSVADLTGANLVRANLVRADLTGGADLAHANLTGANLSGADLSWANLTGADLTDARLTLDMTSDAGRREFAYLNLSDPGAVWVPKTCVTWADALESAVPCPVPGEPVSGRPDVR